MNVAGRKIVGSRFTPLRPGSQVVKRLLDVAGDLQRVARRLLLDDQEQARPRRLGLPPFGSAEAITASPIGGGKPILTSATSPSLSGAPLRIVDRRLGEVLGGLDRRAVPDGDPLVGHVDEPPAATAEVSVTALTTVSSVTPLTPQPVGVDQDLVLPVALAPDRHVRHARDRHQPRPDRPLGQERQLHLRERLRRHADLEQPAGRREGREDHRRPAPPPAAAAPRPRAAPAPPAAPPSGRSPP